MSCCAGCVSSGRGIPSWLRCVSWPPRLGVRPSSVASSRCLLHLKLSWGRVWHPTHTLYRKTSPRPPTPASIPQQRPYDWVTLRLRTTPDSWLLWAATWADEAVASPDEAVLVTAPRRARIASDKANMSERLLLPVQAWHLVLSTSMGSQWGSCSLQERTVMVGGCT